MTRTRSITFLAGATALVLAALAVAGCGSSGGSNTSGSPAPPEDRERTVGHGRRRERELGKILVDSQGRTLYLFQKDSGTKSTCTGACAIDWPPLRATGKPTVGSGATASIVATSARSDGKPQVTYNGHPLYLFSGDQKPGDTNGRGRERLRRPLVRAVVVGRRNHDTRGLRWRLWLLGRRASRGASRGRIVAPTTQRSPAGTGSSRARGGGSYPSSWARRAPTRCSSFI